MACEFSYKFAGHKKGDSVSKITQRNNELLKRLKEKERIFKENKKEASKHKKTKDNSIKKETFT